MRLIPRALPEDFFKYLIVGTSTVAVDFGLLIFLKQYAGFNVFVAATISFWTSILVNFLLNKFWTFEKRGNTPSHVIAYGFLISFNFLASLLIIYVLGLFGISYIIAKLVYIGCSMLWNFAAYKHLVFHDKPVSRFAVWRQRG